MVRNANKNGNDNEVAPGGTVLRGSTGIVQIPNDENDETASNVVKLPNPNIVAMPKDVLYHLGFATDTHDLKDFFHDVKFVCVGGTGQRMESFANFIRQELSIKLTVGTCLHDLTKHSNRYSMFKAGPVLSVSHGMGVPSLSILMHELIKLLYHAQVKDPVFFRIGTSGGIGLKPGTVVITNKVYNDELQEFHRSVVLGQVIKRPTTMNLELVNELLELGKCNTSYTTVTGGTMCADDFYEGQGRVDGAFCDHDLAQKAGFLDNLSDLGILNIEMEATCFAAMTYRAKIKSAIVCVTLLDRVKGDQIATSKEEMMEWQLRPQCLVASYIRKCLNIGDPDTRYRGDSLHLPKK